jgi:chorismate synthase
MLRFLTAGESHGPALATIVEGLPAGLAVTSAGLSDELARRRLGYGRGRRMTLEKDEIEIIGGVRFGKTLGSPVAVVVRNTEWPRWREEMSAESGESKRPLRTPRPGHADLAGMIKYDTRDARDILERASARETAARTVVGYLAKQLLASIDVGIVSHVVSIGSVQVESDAIAQMADQAAIDESEVRVLDRAAAAAMIDEIEKAKQDRNTLGGVFEVVIHGLPVGIGSHVHWDRKLDAELARAFMSIQAIKGVEIGDAFDIAATPGFRAHDEIYHDGSAFVRRTNRAGGLEGGMTIGDVVRIRAAMKPISTVMRPLDTVDVETKAPEKAFRERSDVCAVPAAAVVGEQMAAFAVAREVQRKFGGDTVAELQGSVAAYREHIASF